MAEGPAPAPPPVANAAAVNQETLQKAQERSFDPFKFHTYLSGIIEGGLSMLTKSVADSIEPLVDKLKVMEKWFEGKDWTKEDLQSLQGDSQQQAAQKKAQEAPHPQGEQQSPPQSRPTSPQPQESNQNANAAPATPPPSRPASPQPQESNHNANAAPLTPPPSRPASPQPQEFNRNTNAAPLTPPPSRPSSPQPTAPISTYRAPKSAPTGSTSSDSAPPASSSSTSSSTSGRAIKPPPSIISTASAAPPKSQETGRFAAAQKGFLDLFKGSHGPQDSNAWFR